MSAARARDRESPPASLALRFCGLELRLADRAALRLRRLRRGVHARRGLQQPRRRRARAQGDHAGAAAGQSAAPCVRDARRACSMRSGCRIPASTRWSGASCRTLELQRDAVHRQRLRLDGRGVRRGHAPLRRFAASMRSRSTSPAPTSRKAASSSATCRRCRRASSRPAAASTKQAADHQAVAQSDRYPRERALLHRGRHRCASRSSIP